MRIISGFPAGMELRIPYKPGQLSKAAAHFSNIQIGCQQQMAIDFRLLGRKISPLPRMQTFMGH
jgi:hypothetical protein